MDPLTLESHCADCGLVLAGPVMVNYAGLPSQDKGSGSGRGMGPTTSPRASGRQLGTTVSGSRDARGHALSRDAKSHYGHLGWMMRRELSRGSLRKGDSPEALEVLARASGLMGLPAVVREEAGSIFHEGSQRGLFRGRSLPASVGAAIYAACRRYRLPHTLVEVSEALSIRRWEVGRAFKTLNRGLPVPVPIIHMKSYLQRYAEELALSPTIRSTVEEMLESTSARPEVSGLSPHGLVAALIYLASEKHGERKRRSDIAKLGSITEMTLRTNTKLLDKLLKESSLRSP